MQFLQRTTAVAKLHGQPVEQLRMRRRLPHAAKVIWRIRQPAPKVILPDAIRDDAPGEGIAIVSDPLRERDPAGTLRLARRDLESGRELVRDRDGARADL